MSRMKKLYKEEVIQKLMEKFKYSSVMAVPKIEKVVVNIGLGEAINDGKVLDAASGDIVKITGQKPVITRAKRSIASFKLRKGMPIGCMVTLRKKRMYEFLDKLINVSLPRVRDFRGVSPKSMDGRGNYSLGFKEQIIFPEIDYDKIDKSRGMAITIVTSAYNDEEALYLLKFLGMPFKNFN